METKTRKTTMIGAALAVAIIALAGAGYAAVTQYTATTTNTNNYMDTTYMTVTQSGTGMYTTSTFLTDLYFDSVTNYDADANPAVSVEYTPVYTHYSNYSETAPTGEGTPEKAFALISNVLTLTVAQEGTPVDKVNIAVTAGGVCNFNPKLVYTLYIMSDATGAEPKTATDVSAAVTTTNTAADPTWTFQDVALSKTGNTTLTVMLFVSLAQNVDSLTAEEATTGFGTGGETLTAQNTTSFEFKLTATPATPASP